MNRPTIAVLTALAALGAGSGAALASTAHKATASTTVNTRKTALGTILVNSAGHTLYLDQGDKPPHFACTGACLKAWPPLKATGKLMAKGSAKQSYLSSVKDGGVSIVTYKGHPLYTFTGDVTAGSVSGEGESGFYAVNASGAKVSNGSSSHTTTSSSSSNYGY